MATIPDLHACQYPNDSSSPGQHVHQTNPQSHSQGELLAELHLQPKQHNGRIDGEVKVDKGRVRPRIQAEVDNVALLNTRPLNVKVPLRLGRLALSQQGARHGEQGEQAPDDHEPQDELVQPARVQQPREQRDDGQLGQAEGEDAGAKGNGGPEDDGLLVIIGEEGEVLPVAVADGDLGQGYGEV